MNADKLKAILDKHRDWVFGNDGGERAELRYANLRDADLRDADLRDANLRDADLRGANLWDADLRYANLRGANLQGAELQGAELQGANLQGANLRGAELRGANLRGAKLRDADLRGAELPAYQICHGSLSVWKKGNAGHLINLKIPAKAKRTASLVGRKCRAEYAKVIAIYDSKGKKVNSCGGWHDNDFKYTVGETVKPDKYDDDIRLECTHGIHFFLTKEEAEQW